MRKTLLAVAAAFTLILAGCGATPEADDAAPAVAASTEAASTPEPATPSAPADSTPGETSTTTEPAVPAPAGSLRDRCADGDLTACDELYWTSELGSEDEKFAASCGGTVADPVGGLCSEDMSAILADPTLLRMVLAGMFAEMSTEEVEETCSTYDTVGAAGMAEVMAEQLPGADLADLEEFFGEVFEEMCA